MLILLPSQKLTILEIASRTSEDCGLAFLGIIWHNRLMTCQIATIKIEPIRESDLRSALLEYIPTVIDDSSRIEQEFRIERGGARVDVAVIGTKLVGYEIKSDLDTFTRLSNQIHAYNRVFDEIHLVCSPFMATQAMQIIPSWWGVIVLDRDNICTTSLRTVRNATRNLGQDAFSLASLLWRDEAVAVLTSEEKVVPPKASSHVLWDCISKSLSVEKIKSIVSQNLLRRYDYNEIAVKTI
jgi:hypothetical protein